jgi:xylulokinase
VAEWGMARLLGIDIGTSACKVVLVDDRGTVIGQASRSYPLHSPRPTWSEQDPEDWWSAVRGCIEEVGEGEPSAIGLTGQMHGAVFLDGEGRPQRRAILWNDQRTTVEAREIEDRVGRERFLDITGNPALTGFQAPKYLWVRRHEPEVERLCRSLLLPKDFVRYRLTGERVSDVSDASGTCLLDLRARRWSDEVIQGLDIDPRILPEVAESSSVVAWTRGLDFLKDGIPVVAGGGDQAAGAVGVGSVVPGVVSVSLGTSGVVFTSMEEPRIRRDGAAHTFCHANGAWHAMTVMLSCGGAVRWCRDALGLRDYDELNRLAAEVEAGSEGVAFVPYLTGERSPHNDPSATGAWAGLRVHHGRGHLARAVLEGVSFGLLDGLDVLRDLGASPGEVRLTGGGARSPLWRQILADAFGVPCRTLEADEGPALGAALLAGVGIGVWRSVGEACSAAVRPAEATEPSGADYTESLARYRKLYPALRSAEADRDR